MFSHSHRVCPNRQLTFQLRGEPSHCVSPVNVSHTPRPLNHINAAAAASQKALTDIRAKTCHGYRFDFPLCKAVWPTYIALLCRFCVMESNVSVKCLRVMQHWQENMYSIDKQPEADHKNRRHPFSLITLTQCKEFVAQFKHHVSHLGLALILSCFYSCENSHSFKKCVCSAPWATVCLHCTCPWISKRLVSVMSFLWSSCGVVPGRAGAAVGPWWRRWWSPNCPAESPPTHKLALGWWSSSGLLLLFESSPGLDTGNPQWTKVK